jgi:ATP-dependent RNA helicase DDX24/MAK5
MAGVPVLPRGLEQLEVRVATEDKDAMAYYYLLRHPGRTLLFVNSIKTARRVDGLLRALGLNCRCLHAQLQQKQRIKALESFVSSPLGVLVATDVAARGLDLPAVQLVLHYDVARSPQVYIHRSGRTARAGAKGVALSVVAPEDTDHHRDVCGVLKVKTLSLLRGMDLGSVPLVRERVRLAKKIFLQSFLASQSSKQLSWLETTAREAGLAVDERLEREMRSELDTTTGGRVDRDEQKVKRTLEGDRAKLRGLLAEPYQEDLRANPRHKRAFIVVAK